MRKLTLDRWQTWLANPSHRFVDGENLIEVVPPSPVIVPASVSIVQAMLAMHATPGNADGKTLLDALFTAVAEISV